MLDNNNFNHHQVSIINIRLLYLVPYQPQTEQIQINKVLKGCQQEESNIISKKEESHRKMIHMVMTMMTVSLVPQVMKIMIKWSIGNIEKVTNLQIQVAK